MYVVILVLPVLTENPIHAAHNMFTTGVTQSLIANQQ